MKRQGKKRISKRTREQAMMLCALAASNMTNTIEADTIVGAGPGAVRLAGAALDYVFEVKNNREWYAEAEALLRTGWSP